MNSYFKKGLIYACFILLFSFIVTNTTSAATVKIVKVESINSLKVKATLSNKNVKYITIPWSKKLIHGQDYVHINYGGTTKKYTLEKPFISASYVKALDKVEILEETSLSTEADIAPAKSKSSAATAAINVIVDASPNQINSLKSRRNFMDKNIAGYASFFRVKKEVEALNTLTISDKATLDAFYAKYEANSEAIYNLYDFTDIYDLSDLELELEDLEVTNDEIFENKSSSILSVMKNESTVTYEKSNLAEYINITSMGQNSLSLDSNVLIFNLIDNVKDFSTIELATKYLKPVGMPTYLIGPGKIQVIRHEEKTLEFDLYVNFTNLFKFDANLYHVVIPSAKDTTANITIEKKSSIPQYYIDALNFDSSMLDDLVPVK